MHRRIFDINYSCTNASSLWPFATFSIILIKTYKSGSSIQYSWRTKNLSRFNNSALQNTKIFSYLFQFSISPRVIPLNKIKQRKRKSERDRKYLTRIHFSEIACVNHVFESIKIPCRWKSRTSNGCTDDI